jgi:hypothetical protein
MKWLFDIAVALVTLAVGAAVAGAFWPKIRESVAAWLRNNGLSESALMDAWLALDRIASSVRSRILVKTAQRGEVVIEERYLTQEEIDDPELREILGDRQTAIRKFQFTS